MKRNTRATQGTQLNKIRKEKARVNGKGERANEGRERERDYYLLGKESVLFRTRPLGSERQREEKALVSEAKRSGKPSNRSRTVLFYCHRSKRRGPHLIIMLKNN